MSLFLHRAGIMNVALSAFPVVQTRNTGADAVQNTSYSAPLPSGLTSGDLLIVIGALNSAFATQFNTPSGWTSLFQTAGPGNTRSLACFYKTSNGSEGANLAMTLTALAAKASVSYRISGAAAAPQAGTAATGTSTAPDAPNLSPSWGSQKVLWLAAMAGQWNTAQTQTAPANYSNIQQIAAGTDQPRIASAERSLEASSENPGAFSAQMLNWIANTIAVRG